ALAAFNGPLADAHVGDRYRQHDQVGEHDDCHTHRRANWQLEDHADIQDQQRDEAHRVGQDGNHAGQEQLAEGTPRRHQRVVGDAGLQRDPVDLQYAMGDTDGEDQEGHQHRIGIQPEADQMDQPQLPDHRDQGGHQYRQGAADTPGEPVQQAERDTHRHREEQHDRHQAIDQVTDLLGEADDVDLDIRILVDRKS